MSRPCSVHASRPAPAAATLPVVHSRRAPLGVLLLLLLLLVVPAGFAVPPAAAQTAFPSPVVAPVLPGEETAVPLAVTSLRVDDADEAQTLVVAFRQPFELPEVFRYRIALHVGDPAGASERISLLAESGAVEGVVEEGTDGNWTPLGATEVDFDAGQARLVLPDDLSVEATDLAWVEVASVATEGGASQRFLTPLFPATDLLAPAGPQLTAASVAWGSINQQPPEAPVASGVPPTVQLEDGEVVLTFASALPTTVGDTPVANVVDVVRVAPDFEAAGVAPYLVAIDHGLGTVSLLDGTQVLPVEVATDGSWVTEGLPEGGIEAGGTIRFELADVLDAFGLPPESADAALGVARSVTLEGGQVVRADGPLGTTEWFEAAAVAPPVSTPADSGTTLPSDGAPAEEAAAPASESDSSQSLLPVIAVVCVVVLLGAAAWLTLRWLEHRRHLVVTGGAPGNDPKPSVLPTVDERARLEAFTSELFGAAPAEPERSSPAEASLFAEPDGSTSSGDESAPVAEPAAVEPDSGVNVDLVLAEIASLSEEPEPVEETVAAEEPVVEEPVVEEPVVEEPVVEEPEPVEETVAAEEPLAEEPVVEETVAAEEPVVEEPVALEPTPMRPSGNPAADLLTDLLNAEVDRLGPAADAPPSPGPDADPLPENGSSGLPSRSRK